MGNTVCRLETNYSSMPICCTGGKGTFLGGGVPFPGIDDAPSEVLAVIYLLLLLWTFLGVALAADVFMAAIEEITSQEKDIMHVGSDGSSRRFRARVWNPTVANLTLMALGSSAPEILLSLIELVTNSLYSGELGPSTIVGSAAFNLLVIIAVCVHAIPASDSRKIVQPKVYAVTATASVFAYVWLVMILQVITPDVIDVWEAFVTFFFFPVLVWIAFVADKSDDASWRAAHPLTSAVCLPRCCLSEDDSRTRATTSGQVLLSLEQLDGSKSSKEDMAKALKRLKKRKLSLFEKDDDAVIAYLHDKHTGQAPKSRAWYRVQAVRGLTATPAAHGAAAPPKAASYPGVVEIEAVDLEGKKGAPLATYTQATAASTVEFLCSTYSVIENGGSVTVGVGRKGTEGTLSVQFKTEDGTATAGSDYVAQQGTLQFLKGQEKAFITLQILDDDEIEVDETFTLRLLAVSEGDGAIGALSSTVVTIVNDDFAGTFTLPNEDVVVPESCGEAEVRVERVNGCIGRVSLQYKTVDRTARAPNHYKSVEGTLEWGDKEVDAKVISVPIVDDDILQGKQYFEVELFNATGGATFDAETDGSHEKSLARVTIEDDEQLRTLVDKAVAMIGLNREEARLGSASYAEQFSSACSIEEDAGCCARLSHYLALPWKLLVACVPPTSLCGGKLCFFAAIILIGLLTAFIGDLANLLGCAVGLKPAVVAITLVALGTSLPDTFASKSAALGDESADAAVGNVTGSNSVNVFLGLGVSWLVGSLFWTVNGATEEWLGRYPKIAQRYNVRLGSSVGLAVPAGDLGFSVSIFIGVSLICLATLTLRRLKLGAELGLAYRAQTAGFFVFLWLTYVTLSSLKAYEKL